jgi:GxxExxY protein
LDDLNQLTERIIGCGIEVHRHLGPGLLEATYEQALCIELADSGLKYSRQVPFPILYKGRTLENIVWICLWKMP